jgi:hypothetical protein
MARLLGSWVCTALFVALSPMAVSAQEVEPLSVSPREAACPSRDAIHARLTTLLGGAIPADVRVVLRLDATPVVFELSRDGEEPAERSFDVLPASCDARADALALAIAVAIDASVLERIAAEGRDGDDGGGGGDGGDGGTGGSGGGGPSFGIYIGPGIGPSLRRNVVRAGTGGEGGSTTSSTGEGGWSFAIFDADTLDGVGPMLLDNDLTAGTPGTGGQSGRNNF